MGTYYTARAIIGVKINLKKYETSSIRRDRGCKHPVSDGNFCPVCGAKMWKEQKVHHQSLDIHHLINELPENYTGDSNYDSKIAYIGYGISCEPSESFTIPLADIEEIKKNIKNILSNVGNEDDDETINIWDEDIEKSFGLICTHFGH